MSMQNEFVKIKEDLKLIVEDLSHTTVSDYNSARKFVPHLGVCVLYEKEHPMHVLSDKNLPKRLRCERRKNASFEKAKFAFMLARDEALEKGFIKREEREKDLVKNDKFLDLFTKAKERVRKMRLKAHSLSDETLCEIAEIYMASEYGTERYNYFK